MNATQRKMKEILSGAPKGAMDYFGNGLARDERGMVFKVESLARVEAKAKYAAAQEAIENGGRSASFVFNVMDNMGYVGNVLTSAQCGYLLVLSTYINYDGLLVTSERGNPMTRADMLTALKLRESQRSTLSDFLTTCINYGIIREEYDGFAISSGFHFRGKMEEVNVAQSVITKLREMASENKPEHLGFIYKLIPYINKYSNSICANPNEQIPSRRQKLNRKQVAEVTGVSPTQVSRIISTMTYEGKSVFAKVSTATEGTFYMLNPTIFRRAIIKDYDNFTRDIFGID